MGRRRRGKTGCRSGRRVGRGETGRATYPAHYKRLRALLAAGAFSRQTLAAVPASQRFRCIAAMGCLAFSLGRTAVAQDAGAADAGRAGPRLTRPPRVKTGPNPVYPAAALAANVSAEVTLQLDLDAAGQVTAVAITRPGGPGFDEAALAAAAAMEFDPAEIDGVPAAIRIEYVMRFRPPAVAASPADGGADAGPSSTGTPRRDGRTFRAAGPWPDPRTGDARPGGRRRSPLAAGFPGERGEDRHHRRGRALYPARHAPASGCGWWWPAPSTSRASRT